MEEDKLVRFGKTATLFFIITSFFLLVLFWRHLPPEIPLFYSKPWGKEQLGTPPKLSILLGASILVLLAGNSLLKILSKEGLVWQIVTTAATLFSFLSFLAILRIIMLVI